MKLKYGHRIYVKTAFAKSLSHSDPICGTDYVAGVGSITSRRCDVRSYSSNGEKIGKIRIINDARMTNNKGK